ncbi:MAG: MFS transporter, partial [Actinomycetota bacterium]
MTTSDAAAASPGLATVGADPVLPSEAAVAATRRRWASVAALLGATFVGTVNNSIANVAVPSIAEDLDVDLTAAVWTISAFVLPLGILMPLAGRIGDMYGARRVFLAGTGLFAVASLVVASADHIAVVILGRALQGAAGSPVLPCILATIARLFPPAERARAVALWAGVNAAALAAGPALGGVIVDGLGWRAIFWLSAPAMVVVGVLVAVLVPPDGRSERRRLDLVGAGLVALLLTTLVVPLTEGASWGWLHPLTLVPLAVSATTAVVLVRHVRRVEEPFVDPALLRQPGLVPVASVASLQMVAL